MKNLDYTPEKYGAVVAIRIFFENDRQPMAELAFAFGGTAIINWICPSERKKFESGINGYTLVYDERPKADFSNWVKPYYKDLKMGEMPKEGE